MVPCSAAARSFLVAGIHVRGASDGRDRVRGQGQVREEPADHQSLPGKTDASGAETDRQGQPGVSATIFSFLCKKTSQPQPTR